MTAHIYQVLIYEKYNHSQDAVSYSFSDLLRVTNKNNNSFDFIDLEEKQIILLKGDYAILRFQDFLSRYHQVLKPQEGSPLDSIFIAYGRSVSELTDIYLSYEDACHLMERRFFCEHKQHTLGYEELLDLPNGQFELSEKLLQEYSDKLVNYIQAFHKHQVNEVLSTLFKKLYRSNNTPLRIKQFMIDLYLMVKEKVYHLYNKSDIPFLPNGTIIEEFNKKYYLYEIIDLFQAQCEMIIRSIGDTSHENIIDNIIHYIKHNYMNNMKLETIAPLFGYNSSYLGKIFNKKMGMNFNSYVDSIRIEKSKELLEHETLKVYEVAARVGYQNVDYFHMKFKKYMNMSPAEYRKKARNFSNT
jgi:two-component system response regulator YesN